jgi:predicted nuclease of restriction endonuclease-like (RecB) superfamily
MAGQTIIDRPSFSRLAEMIQLDDSLKSAFYESECINGSWSARKLKRQIASLYDERSVLSRNKAKLARRTNSKAEKTSARQLIRDPYVFEFLGLKPREAISLRLRSKPRRRARAGRRANGSAG